MGCYRQGFEVSLHTQSTPLSFLSTHSSSGPLAQSRASLRARSRCPRTGRASPAQSTTCGAWQRQPWTLAFADLSSTREARSRGGADVTQLTTALAPGGQSPSFRRQIFFSNIPILFSNLPLSFSNIPTSFSGRWPTGPGLRSLSITATCTLRATERGNILVFKILREDFYFVPQWTIGEQTFVWTSHL